MGQSDKVRPARRRVVRVAMLMGVVLALSGCSAELNDQMKRLGLPEPASEETSLVSDLWIGIWIAAAVIGFLVWGLILWSAVAYRRRSDELPLQTRYNMPIEFLYTATPLVIIGVIFMFTVDHQNELLDTSEAPDHTVEVIGQQWAWTFNYVDEDVYEVGTTLEPTTLYLPVDQTVQFNLESTDVIHSFWVPSFYMKMDVIPGEHNSFQVTPDVEGTFAGKCAELCGVYHSRMLFNVVVLPEAEYEEKIEELRAAGQTGQIDASMRGAYSERPLDEVGSEQ